MVSGTPSPIKIEDSYFVGKYSPDGLTALSVIFPVQLIITALAVGTGVGVNTQMARRSLSSDYITKCRPSFSFHF